MKKFGFIFYILFFLMFSCKRESGPSISQQTPELPVSASISTYSWYYIDSTSVNPIDSIKDVPPVAKKPWTEAIRISSASVAGDISVTMPKSYAVVNRVGVIEFDGDDFELFPDKGLFSGRTADNLVFVENTPFFLLYKNSFFNESIKKSTETFRPFLAHFSPSTHVSSPAVALENVFLPKNSEINDFVWDGTTWYCSIKALESDKSVFSYSSLQPTTPLLSLTPATATSSFLIEEIEKDQFRFLKAPYDYDVAPQRLREILAGVPEEIPFYILCYTAGGHSPRAYARQEVGDMTVPLVANACIAETWIVCTFQDGTVYMRGAPYGKPLMNDGNIIAFKLPELPGGFVYGNSFISGTNLYVAWEETLFYETGRSGFLSVDLSLFLK